MSRGLIADGTRLYCFLSAMSSQLQWEYRRSLPLQLHRRTEYIFVHSPCIMAPKTRATRRTSIMTSVLSSPAIVPHCSSSYPYSSSMPHYPIHQVYTTVRYVTGRNEYNRFSAVLVTQGNFKRRQDWVEFQYLGSGFNSFYQLGLFINYCTARPTASTPCLLVLQTIPAMVREQIPQQSLLLSTRLCSNA